MMTELERQDIDNIASVECDWAKLKGKTVLISGGTGFIGQFVINVLRRRNELYGDGIKIVSLSRRGGTDADGVRYVSADVTQKIEPDGDIDFVLHLASNTHPRQYSSDPVGTVTTNILGAHNLLELAVKKRAQRFLLASSVEIYGAGGASSPINESYCGYIDCNTVRAGYNEAKRLSESLCRAYSAQFGVDCVTARLSRVFGADKKDDSKAMAQFLKCAVLGEDIVLKSAGAQRFSYCYVADAASGIIKVLLDGKSGEAYNVSDDDDGDTLGGYAEYIAGLAGKRLIRDIKPDEGASKADYAVLDCTKLKALGWVPLYDVKSGLERTYKIFKARESGK